MKKPLTSLGAKGIGPVMETSFEHCLKASVSTFEACTLSVAFKSLRRFEGTLEVAVLWGRGFRLRNRYRWAGDRLPSIIFYGRFSL